MTTDLFSHNLSGSCEKQIVERNCQFINFLQNSLFDIMRPIIAIILFACTCAVQTTDTFAQSASKSNALESGLFARKSITLVPLAVNDADYRFLVEKTEAGLRTAGARFDYNYVSADALRQAQTIFASQRFFADSLDKNENIQALTAAVRQSGVLERIIAQAGNIDSLNARNNRMKRRITTSSAQSRGIEGISAKEIFSLVNGAFIGVPILTRVGASAQDRDIVNAKGFIYWMQIEVPPLAAWGNNDLPPWEKVTLLPIKQRRALGGAVRIGKETEGELKATAMTAFVQEIFDLAASVPELKPRATLQQVSDGIRLDVGSREAVYLDQGYEVFETQMGLDGTLSSVRKGFVRIGDVANNEQKMDALSAAYPTTFGSLDVGMSAVAHDQFIDFVLRPSYRTLQIPQASVNNLFRANLISASATSSYNLNASLLFNMARSFGIPQFFLGIDGGIGLVNMNLVAGEQQQQGTNTAISINQPLMVEGSVVAVKKFWLGGLAAVIEANIGINSLHLSGLYGGRQWSLRYGTFSFAAGLNAGVEFTISPDMIIGLDAGYRAVLPVTALTLNIDGSAESIITQLDQADLWRRGELGSINLGGLRAGIRATFTIPAF